MAKLTFLVNGKRLTADVRELIRVCGRERALIVAHDWGGGRLAICDGLCLGGGKAGGDERAAPGGVGARVAH